MFEVQGLILLGIIISAAAALISRDLLVSVIYLAFMSLLLSLEFYLLQAPDVAIAEAGVGAGVLTAIYVITIKKTKRWECAEEDI